MIDNSEMPIGFTMELAQHSDILTRFAELRNPDGTNSQTEPETLRAGMKCVTT